MKLDYVEETTVVICKVGMDCRQIQFCDQKRVDLLQLQALFQVAAFWATDRCGEDLAIAIANSDPVITAWDRDLMIGFARATSDGVYRATIWDVVIHPDYQGAGLGRQLMQTVLSHPKMNRVERIYLMTTHQQPFYERLGFECNTSTTMVLHKRAIGTPRSPVTVSQPASSSAR